MRFLKFEDFKAFINDLDAEVKKGTQATIYLETKKERAIKIFIKEDEDNKYKNISDKEILKIQQELSSNEKKVGALIELSKKYKQNNILFPIEPIIINNTCWGYIMPLAKNAKPFKTITLETKKGKNDLKKVLLIAIELAKMTQKIHYDSIGIILGDVHSCQFLLSDNKVYICDTDTWGLLKKGFQPELVGKPEYIDPLVKKIVKDGFLIEKYTHNTDNYSLAMIIFEILTGFSPFDGKYKKDKRMDKSIRAIKKISILGNHDIEKMKSLQIKHLVWMSIEMQQAFLRIFEYNERFNLLSFLEEQLQDLAYCNKHKCYYSKSRYHKCPACTQTADEFFENFRKLKGTSLVKTNFQSDVLKGLQELEWIPEKDLQYYLRFESEYIRKIINNNVYFDYIGKVHYYNSSGEHKKEKVSSRVTKMFFLDSGYKIVFKRKSKTYISIQTNDRMKKVLNCHISDKNAQTILYNENDPICQVKIYYKTYKKPVYEFLAAEKASEIKVCGTYLFYIFNHDLIRLDLSKDKIEEMVVIKNVCNQYYCNNKGDFAILKHTSLSTKVIINGIDYGEVPFTKKDEAYMKYDMVKNEWYVIGKNRSTGNIKIVYINANCKVFYIELDKQFNNYSIINSEIYNGICFMPNDGLCIAISIKFGVYKEYKLSCITKESKLTITNEFIDVVNEDDNSVYRMILKQNLPVNEDDKMQLVNTNRLYLNKLYYAIVKAFFENEPIIPVNAICIILIILLIIFIKFVLAMGGTLIITIMDYL